MDFLWIFDGFGLHFGIDFLIFSMNSASLFRGCFWTDFSMNNNNFSNFWFFENVILTYVKLMILHNQQAVPRLQIHRFVHDYLRNFCIDCSWFFMFFRYRFRDWLLITYLMENGFKKTSKIDPRGDLFGPKGSKSWVDRTSVSVLERTFFRASIFRCLLVPFRRPFGQCWALLAPFGPLLAPCWALLAPF